MSCLRAGRWVALKAVGYRRCRPRLLGIEMLSSRRHTWPNRTRHALCRRLRQVSLLQLQILCRLSSRAVFSFWRHFAGKAAGMAR